MESTSLPLFTLRRELLQGLTAIYESANEGTFPAVPPRQIIDLLNDVGPPLDGRALPVVEMLLDALWQDGLIGRIPAPSPRHTCRYMCRESALAAIGWNAPVTLLPTKDETEPKR